MAVVTINGDGKTTNPNISKNAAISYVKAEQEKKAEQKKAECAKANEGTEAKA